LVKTLPEYRGAFHQLYRRIARLVTGWERKGLQWRP
jgi:hypothetical protein